MKTKKCEACDIEVSSRKKWCLDCVTARKKARDIETGKKRRIANKKPCAECKEAMTGSKYCVPCANKVKARNNKISKAKHKKLCRECKCDISYRAKHAKLCETCVVIVDARNYEKRKADMRANKVVKQEVDLSKWTKRGTIHYEGLRSLAV